MISPNVRVNSPVPVEGSMLMEGVQIGRYAVVRAAIPNTNVVVPQGARNGVDPDRDRARYAVADRGIVVIGKGQPVQP